MPTCPNCGNQVSPGATLCPNCGAVVSPVWPPPPAGYNAPTRVQGEPLLTGSASQDFSLGLGSLLGLQTLILVVGYYNPSVLFPALFAVGGVGLIVYFAVRPRYPVLARGIGWGTVFVPLFLLGAVVVCMASVFHFKGGL